MAVPGGEPVQLLDQLGSWLAPAPSQVTMSLRRSAGGRASMASRSSRRWSAAVLLPAEPGRSIQASGSATLSHSAMMG